VGRRDTFYLSNVAKNLVILYVSCVTSFHGPS
jgi:hypothetical protein